jgi:hypothetical protein
VDFLLNDREVAIGVKGSGRVAEAIRASSASWNLAHDGAD